VKGGGMKMVTLDEVESVWGNADFGPKLNANKMDVVKYGLLKCAGGYYQGYTSQQICTELGLLTKGYNLTKRGRYCLFEFFVGSSTL
jgi:hypothetical protein